MIGVLLTCLALVAFPIIVVQYQRYKDYHAHFSEAGTVDTNFDGTGEETRTPRPSSSSFSSASASASASKSIASSSQQSPRALPSSEESTTRGAIVEKKPWDPPFRKRKESGAKLPWKILGPASKDAMREDVRSVTQESIPRVEEVVADHGPIPATEPQPDPMPVSGTFPTRVADSRNPTTLSEPISSLPERVPSRPTLRESPTHGFRLPLLQWVLLILAVLIFVFSFAVLIAHCLAWFIVYKTEARLGEARKGLLSGGDMRICLCARS